MDGVRHDIAGVHRLPGHLMARQTLHHGTTSYLSEEEILCIVTVLPTFSPKIVADDLKSPAGEED